MEKVLNLENTEDKLSNFRVCYGRVEVNYIATNPQIFEDFKLGDKLVCMENTDYFRMHEGILDLMGSINDLLSIIIELLTDINELDDINHEFMTKLRIRKLNNVLNRLRKVK